jgi:hypothetical protein
MRDIGRVLVAVALIAGTAGACSESPDRNQPTRISIQIEVETGGGQAWTTSRGSIGSGPMCEGGSHRWVGYRNQDGSPMSDDDATALRQLQPDLVLVETQLDCADGSGTISIAWAPEQDDRWTVVDGTGAFSGATGGGRVVAGDAGDASMEIRGEISMG